MRLKAREDFSLNFFYAGVISKLKRYVCVKEPSLREFSGIKQQASAAKRYNNLCEKYHRSLMTPDDENIYQTEEDKANNDFCKLEFIVNFI